MQILIHAVNNSLSPNANPDSVTWTGPLPEGFTVRSLLYAPDLVTYHDVVSRPGVTKLISKIVPGKQFEGYQLDDPCNSRRGNAKRMHTCPPLLFFPRQRSQTVSGLDVTQNPVRRRRKCQKPSIHKVERLRVGDKRGCFSSVRWLRRGSEVQAPSPRWRG